MLETSEVDVAPVEELPPGAMKIVTVGELSIGVYNCNGTLRAIEDRCSHDDGPLCHGTWDEGECTVVCPRHGAKFELESGRPLTLPAFVPVRVFPVKVVDGIVKIEI